MPDPATIAATAAGKEVMKKAEPYLALLLKPSFELIGKELRSQLKERIDEWKKRKKEENLVKHIEKVREVLDREPPKPKRGADTLAALDCFEEWADGAQDVDPEDEVLSSMWQQILVDIANGEAVQKALIERLKTLSAPEARVLLRFRGSGHWRRYPENDEERDYLETLRTKQLVSADYTHIILRLGMLAAAILLFSGVASGYREYLAARQPVDRYVLPFIYTPFLYVFSWQVIVAVAVVFIGQYALLLYRRGFARWRLTWMGEKLVQFAKAKSA